MSNLDLGTNTELLDNPKALAVTTATFYPKWYPGKVTEKTVDKIRGDLALETLRKANEQGYQVVLVDGGSSLEFLQAAAEMGIAPSPEKQRGMSGSRRQAFSEAAVLPGVKVIFWLEPEKNSLIDPETLANAAGPILKGEADIVLPSRDQAAFESYPPYQAESEQKANAQYNKVLRLSGLLLEDEPDLDFFFGTRFFANDPKILKLFERVYNFQGNPNLALHKTVKPENYSNATYFPIVQALIDRRKVIAVPVNYTHPAEQTDIENEDPNFDAKRVEQRHNIVTELIHFIKNRLLQTSKIIYRKNG